MESWPHIAHSYPSPWSTPASTRTPAAVVKAMASTFNSAYGEKWSTPFHPRHCNTVLKKRKTCSLLQQQLLGVQHLPCFFWIVLQFLILTPHSMPEVRAHHYILLVANPHHPHHPIFKPPFWSWNPKPFAGFKSPFCIYELYRMWNFPSSHHLGVSRNWATQKRSRFQDKPHGLGWCWGSVLGNPSRKAPLRFYLLPSGYLT